MCYGLFLTFILEIDTTVDTTQFLKNNKAPDYQRHYVSCLAVRTGLEPATHGVTGRYSNQLNYRTIYCAAKLNEFLTPQNIFLKYYLFFSE